jgi:hypothetical protein
VVDVGGRDQPGLDARQGGVEVGHGGEAGVGVDGHGFEDHPLQLGVDPGGFGGDVGPLQAQGIAKFHWCFAAVGQAGRQEHIGRDPQRVLVPKGGRGQALPDLHRDIGHGAQGLAGPGQAAGAVAAGDAEVQDDGAVVVGDQDVGGLQIAVHHALGVCRMQRLCDLPQEMDGAAGAGPVLFGHRRQGPAPDQLHRDEEHIVVLMELVDPADPRVGDLPRKEQLPSEALSQGGLLGVPGMERLDGDALADEHVFGLEDDAKAPLAKLAHQLESPQGVANGQHRAMLPDMRAP